MCLNDDLSMFKARVRFQIERYGSSRIDWNILSTISNVHEYLGRPISIYPVLSRTFQTSLPLFQFVEYIIQVSYIALGVRQSIDIPPSPQNSCVHVISRLNIPFLLRHPVCRLTGCTSTYKVMYIKIFFFLIYCMSFLYFL